MGGPVSYQAPRQKNALLVGIIGQYSPACSKNTEDKYTKATPVPGKIFDWIMDKDDDDNIKVFMSEEDCEY